MDVNPGPRVHPALLSGGTKGSAGAGRSEHESDSETRDYIFNSRNAAAV